MTLKELFTAIAKAIKDKNGNENKIKPIDFPSEIEKISSRNNISLNGLVVANGTYTQNSDKVEDTDAYIQNDIYKITLTQNSINGGNQNQDYQVVNEQPITIEPHQQVTVQYGQSATPEIIVKCWHVDTSIGTSKVRIIDENDCNVLIPENIKSGVWIGDVHGTFIGETEYQQLPDSNLTSGLPSPYENLKGLYAQIGNTLYQCQETELDGKPLSECGGDTIFGQTLFIHPDDKYKGETSLGQEKYVYYLKDASGIENTSYSLNITLEKVDTNGTMKVREVYYKTSAATYYFYQYGSPSWDRDFVVGKGSISSVNSNYSYIGSNDAPISFVLKYIKERVAWYAWKEVQPS